MISARSFYTLFKQHVDDPEFTATLSYPYNFGIPLKEIIKAGDKRPNNIWQWRTAEGIILNLEKKSAITDKNGEYFISTIQPGRHLFFVDRSKFEINEITSIPSPIEVEVFENQETMLNFKITKGAKLTGNISIAEKIHDILKNKNKYRKYNCRIEKWFWPV